MPWHTQLALPCVWPTPLLQVLYSAPNPRTCPPTHACTPDPSNPIFGQGVPRHLWHHHSAQAPAVWVMCCVLCTACCALCVACCMLHGVLCVVCCVWCVMHGVSCVVCAVWCVVARHTTHYTKHTIQNMQNKELMPHNTITQHAMHNTQDTKHRTWYTTHIIQYRTKNTIHSTHHMAHNTQYTANITHQGTYSTQHNTQEHTAHIA